MSTDPKPWSHLLKPPSARVEALIPPHKPTDGPQSGAADALFLLLTTRAVWADSVTKFARRRFRQLEAEGYVRSEQGWCAWLKPKPGLALRYVLVKPLPEEMIRRSFAQKRVCEAKANGGYLSRIARRALRVKRPIPAPGAEAAPSPCPAPAQSGGDGPAGNSPA